MSWLYKENSTNQCGLVRNSSHRIFVSNDQTFYIQDLRESNNSKKNNSYADHISSMKYQILQLKILRNTFDYGSYE